VKGAGLKVDCREISAQYDGLYTPEVGAWCEQKYLLLSNYAQIFATSMKDKWDERVYIDLFSGAGHARLKDSAKIVLSSPLLALSVKDPFDSHIFCDNNPRCIEALQTRTSKVAPGAKVRFVVGDANASVGEIVAHMPIFSTTHRVLGFCFVDPFSLSNLKFETIKALSRRFVDFLVHLPAMDPRRNEDIYVGENKVVDKFLGDQSWRPEWKQHKGKVTFDYFVAQQFSLRMKSLEYDHSGLDESVFVRSTDKNLPLYRLAFYSRHGLGAKFWKEIKKCTDHQGVLF
jgi:three-Cys-motif partner protein